MTSEAQTRTVVGRLVMDLFPVLIAEAYRESTAKGAAPEARERIYLVLFGGVSVAEPRDRHPGAREADAPRYLERTGAIRPR